MARFLERPRKQNKSCLHSCRRRLETAPSRLKTRLLSHLDKTLSSEAVTTPCPLVIMSEEADRRMLLYLQDALQQGASVCLVRTVDTDVVITLLGKFHHLRSMCPTANIWVAFGTGRNFSYIHINPGHRPISWVSCPQHCPCFTASRAATPCRSSWAKENEQHGGLGCHILKSHRPSTSSPPILSP